MEMTAYYGVTRSTYYLEHHGVKGQHWGDRRYQNKDGSLTALGRARMRRAVNATADMVKRHLPSPEKRAAAAKARQARKEQKAAEKRQKELDSYKTDPRKRLKNMDKLTDEELETLKKRIQLENDVADATRNQLQKPKLMADMVLGYADTGLNIANKVVSVYDTIQDFKSIAKGTRQNGKNLVGDELVKFMQAKAKLSGNDTSTTSADSSSSNSGKKDKGSNNSDSSTGVFGGKKKDKGGNDKKPDSGNDGSKAQSDNDDGGTKTSSEGGSKKPSDSATANKEYKGDFIDRLSDKVTAKSQQKDQERSDYQKSKEDYYKQRGGDVSGDWRSATRVDNPYNSRKWVEDPNYATKKAEQQQAREAKQLQKQTKANMKDDSYGVQALRDYYQNRREAGKAAADSAPVKAAMDRPASGSSFTKAASDGKAIVDSYSGIFNQLDNMTSSMLDNNRNKLS